MTERERLLKLLKGAETKVAEMLSSPLSLDEWLGVYADHLLANGVIVPPVALGSIHKVYVPIAGTTLVYGTKVYGIGVDKYGDYVLNPIEYPEKVIPICGFTIGKNVFLTKEEAEKALKERSEG